MFCQYRPKEKATGNYLYNPGKSEFLGRVHLPCYYFIENGTISISADTAHLFDVWLIELYPLFLSHYNKSCNRLQYFKKPVFFVIFRPKLIYYLFFINDRLFFCVIIMNQL